MTDFSPYMHPDAQPEPLETPNAPTAAAPSPTAPSNPSVPTDRCAKCGNKGSQFHGEGDSGLLCDGCWENRRIARLEAENAPSAAQLKIWEESKARLEEFQKAEAARPREPFFCRANDLHRDSAYQAGRPAVGFNARGELCCGECLAKNPPGWLERIAALEAQAQPTAKSTRKAGA